ncbi:MAG TPA: stalk domain-containing protein [Symbiobacteriaceae bacterium]|jgi:hypothetical protein
MRLQRYVVALLTTLVLLLSLVPVGSADDILRVEDLPRVAITIDGNPLAADAYIVNGRTVAPLRAIFEALGATIEWNGATRTVTATKGNTIIKLTIDKTTAYVGDKVVELAVPPLIINARTFVPVRFIGEALGATVNFDPATKTVKIQTGLGCTLPGGQQHSGTIQPGGETWGLCGSPHIISGQFLIQGKDTPVLTIEAGALVQFEADAMFIVGRDAPGGLVVNGTADKPVTLASAQPGATPGIWKGIEFHKQTDKTHASIQNARIENAGYYGAIYLYGPENLVEVLLKNVEISKSANAGIYLEANARLAAGSGGLKISGTKSRDGEGGFPIITDAVGINKLAAGEFKDNDVNGILVGHNSSDIIVGSNTTWSNPGVPYLFQGQVHVAGSGSPVLTVQPGVVALFASGKGLKVGDDGPGSLVADATAKPDGGGAWTIGKTELTAALPLTQLTIAPQCGLCTTNHAIVFGAWNQAPQKGAWEGIRFFDKAGVNSKLNGVVVGYAGAQGEWEAGVAAESSNGIPVKFLLKNSLVTGSASSGVQLWGAVAFQPGSTGNIFTGNAWPLRVQPEQVGNIEAGSTFTGNDNDWISVWTNGAEDVVTKSATWRNHGVPYFMESGANIGGSSKPVVTIEAGTKLVFKDYGIIVGSDGLGSLVAAGTADKPITFTSERGRPGTWRGINFTDQAGAGNKLEYVTIDYAEIGVELAVDLGGFIKNSTISHAGDTGIYRSYDTATGTDFTVGLNNKFLSNKSNTNR